MTDPGQPARGGAVRATSPAATSSCTQVRSYRPGDGTPTRALAMAWAARGARPRWRATCRTASTSSTTRSRCRSRASALPRWSTLFDVQHLAQPQFFSRARAALPALGLRPGGAPRRRSSSASASTAGRRLIERLGARPRAGRGDPDGRRPRALLARAGPSDDAGCGRLAAARRASSSTRRTCGRTRTTSACSRRFARVDDRDLALVLTGQDVRPARRAHAPRRRARDRASACHHLGYVAASPAGALPRAPGDGLPEPLRGLRLAAAGGDGLRLPGRVLARAPRWREVCGDAALAFDPRRSDAIAAAIDRLTLDASLRGRLRGAGPRHAPRCDLGARRGRHIAMYRAPRSFSATPASDFVECCPTSLGIRTQQIPRRRPGLQRGGDRRAA